MISWDTNCLFESMRIGKTSYFFANVKDMICLEKVCEEIEDGKDKFLKECEEILPKLNEEYGLDISISQIKIELENFLKNNTPFTNEQIKKIKEEVIKEICQLKGIKIGKGDLEVISHSRIERLTVVTHDENLF